MPFSKWPGPPAIPADWFRWAIQSVTAYAVFTTDLNNRIITWNRGAEYLFGYRREDVLGENSRFIFTPSDIEERAPEVEAAHAAMEDCAPNERRHVRKDGTIFWATGMMMKMVDDNHRHVGFIKIVREAPGADPHLSA